MTDPDLTTEALIFQIRRVLQGYAEPSEAHFRALDDLAARLEATEKKIADLREAETAARIQEHEGNQGNADAIRNVAIRFALQSSPGGDMVNGLKDALREAEKQIEGKDKLLRRWLPPLAGGEQR